MSSTQSESVGIAPDASQLFSLAAAEVTVLLQQQWRLDKFEVRGQYEPHLTMPTVGWVKNLHHQAGSRPLRSPGPKWWPSVFVLGGKDAEQQPLVAGQWYTVEVEVTEPSQRRKEVDMLVAVAGSIRRTEAPARPDARQASEGEPARKAVRAEAEQLVRARFNKMSSGDPELQQGYAGLLKNYQLEMYLKPTRFLYELLQNADDQPHEGEPVDVTFTLLDHHLVLQHTGASFTDEDVLAISTTAQSVKRNRPEATGYKGIGFKSVFTAASPVYIQSGPYSFRFEKPAENADDTPWQVQPIWTPLREWHPELQDFRMLRDRSLRVSIALYSGSEKLGAYRPVLNDLLSNLRFLLFLRHVGQLQVWDGMERQWAERRKDQYGRHHLMLNDAAVASYVMAQREAAVPEEVTKKLAADEKVPEKLRQAKRVRFSFAAELGEQGGIRKITAGQDKLYCYLPTEVSYQLGFLLNADFVLKSDREGLQQDNAWNNFLFAEIGRALPGWLAELAINGLPEVGAAAYQLLPTPKANLQDISHYQAFSAALAEAVAITACVLTVSTKLVVPAAAIVDEAGLATVLPELYTTHLTGGLELVHPAVVENLSANQEKLLGLKKITQAGVLTLLGKPTVTAYTPQRAVDLLRHVYQSKDAALLTALKSKPWLFDQYGKALTPNVAGQFGVVNEAPDADLPFGEQLCYLHSDLQVALKADLALRTWFESEFLLLPALTRVAALAHLGSLLGAGRVTQVEASAVARYLFGLHSKKELGAVGDSKTLGKLLVLAKENTWRLVTQLYVADYYQPDYPFETLAKDVGSQFSFVAESYCEASEAAAWGRFWGALGAKRPAKMELFKNDLLPLLVVNKLSEAGHDELLKFALRLYSETKPGELDAEWPKLGMLRLRTVGKGRLMLTECLISDTYPAGAEVAERLLLLQGLPEQLAPDYATVPKVTPTVVRQFLAAATGKAAASPDGLTALALVHLMGVGAPKGLTESVRMVWELAALVSSGKLASGLKPLLSGWPLYLKNGQTQVAGRCYLGTEYAPKLDIELLTGSTEKAVLEGVYLEGAADRAGVRALLTDWLGVREKFEPEWHAKSSFYVWGISPLIQPYWDYVHTRSAVLAGQTVEFNNLLVVNNLELVKNEQIAKHLATAIAGEWVGKPETFPKSTYKISGKSPIEMSPWAGPPKFYLQGPAGKSVKVGDRYLSKTLEAAAPKSAWMAMHSWGSAELEHYLGLQTELNVTEQLEAFAEQSQRLHTAALTESTYKQFEKLASPLLAFFKQEVKDDALPAWRVKLRWPAADGSWQPLAELHWLGSSAKKFYDKDRSQLMMRMQGLIQESGNFCLALKVGVVNLTDFKPVPPPGGGRSHTAAFQQRATENQLLRLLVHRRFGYDEPETLALMQQKLAALAFVEVETVQLECIRIPGFTVPVEEGCLVDDGSRTFYFNGSLFTGFTAWRHFEKLGRFILNQLLFDVSPQVVVNLLRARGAAELRECLRDAGWPMPDWLAGPPPTTVQTTSKLIEASSTVGGETEDAVNIESDKADSDSTTAPPSTPYQGHNEGEFIPPGPGVTREKRKGYQQEAREAAILWLRENSYTVADDAHDGYSTFEPVSKNETMWRVVVKSYRGGILYLNPNEWLTLAGENSFLLLYNPRTGQAISETMEQITSLDEIHRRNPNVIVRLENTDPQGSVLSLTQLAEAHQFSGSFKFIFDSPSNKDFDFELTGNHTAKEPLPVDDLDIDLS